nr:unnamed protein product [Callosobruchus chinensis]
MQCEDVEFGVAAALHGSLSILGIEGRLHKLFDPSFKAPQQFGQALNELGMLATSARSEYLNDMYNKKHLNMLTINTRYVSNVSIGFRWLRLIPFARCTVKAIRPSAGLYRNDKLTSNDRVSLEVSELLNSSTVAQRLKKYFIETKQMKERQFNRHMFRISACSIIFGGWTLPYEFAPEIIHFRLKVQRTMYG